MANTFLRPPKNVLLLSTPNWIGGYKSDDSNFSTLSAFSSDLSIFTKIFPFSRFQYKCGNAKNKLSSCILSSTGFIFLPSTSTPQPLHPQSLQKLFESGLIHRCVGPYTRSHSATAHTPS